MDSQRGRQRLRHGRRRRRCPDLDPANTQRSQPSRDSSGLARGDRQGRGDGAPRKIRRRGQGERGSQHPGAVARGAVTDDAVERRQKRLCRPLVLRQRVSRSESGEHRVSCATKHVEREGCWGNWAEPIAFPSNELCDWQLPRARAHINQAHSSRAVISQPANQADDKSTISYILFKLTKLQAFQVA